MSNCQRRVLWHAYARLRFIRNLFSSSERQTLRRPTSGCQRRIAWRKLRGSGLWFCNILFERNNFRPGAVILSILVSELQEMPSPGIELKKLFPEI
jgi:hypothetical protein